MTLPTLPRHGLVAALALLAGCGGGSSMGADASVDPTPTGTLRPLQITAPSPDPRVGLEAGMFDAEEAVWNLRVVSATPPPEEFVGITNSDLAFKGPYAIQGNYNGVQVWDLTDPASPDLVTAYVCPASQSDVSVYGDLMFVSGEGLGGRLDCGTEGVQQAVSSDRLRGIRIFDISDIRNPRYISNVQTCRGSHTHTVLKDPNDDDNVYIYISGSAPVRPAQELPGCSGAMPEDDPNSALFRIEVIRVPLADPASAAIVSSPRIFEDLVAPPTHGLSPADLEVIEEARARGAFIIEFGGQAQVLPDQFVGPMLDSIAGARGANTPNAADSAALRDFLPQWVAQVTGGQAGGDDDGPGRGPTQCHDITVYPEIGLAGGACEGYGLLLDISDPVNPTRLAAVADSNFSYWHSATFDNAGTKVLFTDEWGGGGGPKCRASDPMEWGANAIFTIEGDDLDFRSYYKMPAAQTNLENCVAHNGSLIPIPGRDVMVQSWYQGGISVFDWTDPDRPIEIAFHDRGPSDANTMGPGGSWSVYWYNGVIVSSEIARGLDIFELLPSEALSQNEIDAANTVRFDYLNSQGQPQYDWPHTFSLARAYLDQLERSRAVSAAWIAGVRTTLSEAEEASGSARSSALSALADRIAGAADRSLDADKVRTLAEAVRGLAGQ
ncbi:LVIVD repeat-containing protein [Gaopeijia maritima]|uniref:LVIVD repeat-containing protein n=1 Tax=Gaopeijia maritima TaxID=3119007 RepID=A0ABU9E8J1_9BACT